MLSSTARNSGFALASAGAKAYRAQFTKIAFVRAAMMLYDRVRRGNEQTRRAPAA